MEFNLFHNLLEQWGVGERLIHEFELLFFAVAVTLLILLINLISRRVVIPIIKRVVKKTRNKFDDILLDEKFLKNSVRTLTPIIILIFIPYAVDSFPVLMEVLKRAAAVWLTISITVLICSFFEAIYTYLSAKEVAQQHPLKGFIQMFKIIVICIGLIVIMSIIVNKNPAAILTALGASAAVLMLVFKDTIVGLVAGIQLSANDMLRPGDWISMPKYGVDGDVIEVSLTTVKVENFDKTISTIPPYALISDSFQNWRGMKETGGRRVKRHIPIDMNTIGYLSKEQREDLVSRGWMSADASTDIVNLKVFRDYLENYLRTHTKVHKELTLLVRELQPTSEGIPLELYFFSNTTVWAEYETIQSEVIEHVLSVMPKFGLRAFQRSSGSLSSLENPIKYS
ncbi:MAG TPA: mechanosensitive ion channel [Bacteroidales bacterium]|nr:mechanosensitive ion channel [Bacteroidales bacterium]